MNLFDSLSISGSALAAERQRSEIVAANMANARDNAHAGRRAVPAQGSRLPVVRAFQFPAGSCRHRQLEPAHARHRANL